MIEIQFSLFSCFLVITEIKSSYQLDLHYGLLYLNYFQSYSKSNSFIKVTYKKQATQIFK